MNLDPRPMDPDRLSQLRYRLITGQHLPADIVAELVGDQAWHRARVPVTDDDIRAAGATCAQARAWLREELWTEDRGWRFTAPDGVNIVTVAYGQLRPRAIAAIASSEGKAPLDVLAEIAATEVSDG